MDGLNKSILLWRDWRCMGGREKNTMTVRFDITETPGYGTYLDDATDMPYGKDPDAVSQWQEFFGYKPCLFKNGQVVGYLNPNDYTKFENGTSADITSGNAGDVMVEFPRRGIKISKSGSTVTVSMTKDPDNPDFTYYAHTRGSTRKDKFYVGAYLGYISNNKLRSLSGTSITTLPLRSCRTYASANGRGYIELSFYQYTYIQCMYLLQYKGHLNSQSVHGLGYWYSFNFTTGKSNTKGLMYGTTNYTTDDDHIKLFGIEDVWSGREYFIDGVRIDTSFRPCTTTDNFSDTSVYTTINTTVSDTSCGNYTMQDAVCSSIAGFIPKKSSNPIYDISNFNTYFCNSFYIYEDRVATVSGSGYTIFNSSDYKKSGMFMMHFGLGVNGISSNNPPCGRLAYL